MSQSNWRVRRRKGEADVPRGTTIRYGSNKIKRMLKSMPRKLRKLVRQQVKQGETPDV